MTDLDICLDETQDELDGYYCWIDEIDQCVYAVKASTRGKWYTRSGYPTQWDVEILDVEVRWPAGTTPEQVPVCYQSLEDKIRGICEASCF